MTASGPGPGFAYEEAIDAWVPLAEASDRGAAAYHEVFARLHGVQKRQWSQFIARLEAALPGESAKTCGEIRQTLKRRGISSLEHELDQLLLVRSLLDDEAEALERMGAYREDTGAA